jgi:HK97 family phage major capsid protein
MNSVELRQQRAKLIADARKICNQAEVEKRSLLAEEDERINAMTKEIDDLKVKIDACERTEQTGARLADLERELETSTGRTIPAPAGDAPADAIRVRVAFANYCRTGSVVQLRALSADKFSEGGYLLMPQELVPGFLKAVDDQTFILGKATVHSVDSAASLGIPSLDADPEDSDWTPEIATVDADSAMDFGKRELHPHAASKLVKVSNKLLRRLPGADGMVLNRLAYKAAVTQEKAYLTGNGVGKPLGAFIASANGVSTGRDVATGNSSAVTADGFIMAKMNLKSAYQMKAEWVMHRGIMEDVLLLKDGNGQYLYQPGLRAQGVDTLLSVPVNLSEFAPSTVSNGLYVAMIADWSFYHVARVSAIALQRLSELYAETDQTGFIERFEADGMPVLEEAFSRVKVSA